VDEHDEYQQLEQNELQRSINASQWDKTCYWMDWKIHWIMPRISYGFYRKSSNLDRKLECNHEDGAFLQPASSDRPFLVHPSCVLS
jgi:hypothetical protein